MSDRPRVDMMCCVLTDKNPGDAEAAKKFVEVNDGWSSHLLPSSGLISLLGQLILIDALCYGCV